MPQNSHDDLLSVCTALHVVSVFVRHSSTQRYGWYSLYACSDTLPEILRIATKYIFKLQPHMYIAWYCAHTPIVVGTDTDSPCALNVDVLELHVCD